MNHKLFHRITASFVFVISFFQFILTVQPSVSFWDCGEFAAAAYSLQVPHPPGAPLFTIIGRLFSMIPFAWNTAFKINLISVFSSAFAVMLLYLIAVKLIENYKGKTPKSLFDALGVYIPAAIGALAFSFSDTFWFNGVEAEVYASSTFLFALITWLMVVWNEKADHKDNEKYLLMIAYLIGLSTGVHLMSVLAIVPVVMVITFRKYVQDDEACKQTGYIFLGHAAVVLLVAIALWASQKSTTPPSPDEYHAFDSKFMWIMVGISAVIMAVFRKKIFTRNSIYIPMIFGGVALIIAYPGIVKLLPDFITYIGGDNILVDILVIAILLGILAFLIRWTVKENKPTLNLAFMSLLFTFIGFTTYTMIIVRSNQETPMNENEPNDFSELVSYLNREQYGDFPEFKRRFSAEPHQTAIYSEYSSDLDFFWNYQMNHMFNRYLLWNFAGRQGWEQDMGVDWSQLFGIPFFIGLLGIYFQFKRDWKMAAVFMVLFIFMGYLTAFYQNQQEPQPRERDYFYVGAFFVFAIWIALGIRGIIEWLFEIIKNPSTAKISAYAVLGLGIVLIPFNMARTNWFTHDRSRNWVPWDYSYNLLQSCAPNSILFTNGDNDTFPLWYLQDVEGVRRDIRIANLSLLNTSWYIKQLKNTTPYGSQKVAISYSDMTIDQMEPVRWNPQTVSVSVPPDVVKKYTTVQSSSVETPVPESVIQKYGVVDSSLINTGKISFRMNNTISYGDIKAIRVQDLMVKDIVESNRWQRPIYFAVTCAEDSKIGLQDYLIMEGLASRLVPIKRRGNAEFLNVDLMKKQLFQLNPGFSKDYKPGFKFRGLNDAGIFFDDNQERLTMNYRSSYIRLAYNYLSNGNDKLCLTTLDQMEKQMPSEIRPMPYGLMFEISNIYYAAGGEKQYKEMAAKLEKTALEQLAENPNDVRGNYNPYRVLSEVYGNLKEYNKAVDLFSQLQKLFPDDPGVKSELERYKRLSKMKDSTSTN